MRLTVQLNLDPCLHHCRQSLSNACAVQRACRRHGIQRWPRRQLLKLSKAIDQINATGTLKKSDSTTADGEGRTVLLTTMPQNIWASPALLYHSYCANLCCIADLIPWVCCQRNPHLASDDAWLICIKFICSPR